MAEFNPRQQWLEEYLARPMLWPGQVDAVEVLARELGATVGFVRRDLNDWAAGWQFVESAISKGDDHG